MAPWQVHWSSTEGLQHRFGTTNATRKPILSPSLSVHILPDISLVGKGEHGLQSTQQPPPRGITYHPFGRTQGELSTTHGQPQVGSVPTMSLQPIGHRTGTMARSTNEADLALRWPYR
jgi:hypothetical protein